MWPLTWLSSSFRLDVSEQSGQRLFFCGGGGCSSVFRRRGWRLRRRGWSFLLQDDGGQRTVGGAIAARDFGSDLWPLRCHGYHEFFGDALCRERRRLVVALDQQICCRRLRAGLSHDQLIDWRRLQKDKTFIDTNNKCRKNQSGSRALHQTQPQCRRFASVSSVNLRWRRGPTWPHRNSDDLPSVLSVTCWRSKKIKRTYLSDSEHDAQSQVPRHELNINLKINLKGRKCQTRSLHGCWQEVVSRWSFSSAASPTDVLSHLRTHRGEAHWSIITFTRSNCSNELVS